LDGGSAGLKAATYTQIKTNKYPCLKWDLNPRSQCSSGRRQFMPYTTRPLWSTILLYGDKNLPSLVWARTDKTLRQNSSLLYRVVNHPNLYFHLETLPLLQAAIPVYWSPTSNTTSLNPSLQLLLIMSSRPPQPLLSPGDTIFIASGYPSLLEHNLQHYLPKSIIATITNRKGVQQITKDVFLASESA
jgi:hypothetical protein